MTWNVGYIALLVGLAGLLAAPSIPIVRCKMLHGQGLDALARLAFGTVAFLVSLVAAYYLGDVGGLRTGLLGKIYEWIDAVSGMGPGATFAVVQNLLLKVGVASALNTLQWHALLLIPVFALLFYAVARSMMSVFLHLAGNLLHDKADGLDRGAIDANLASRYRATAKAMLPAVRRLAFLLAGFNLALPPLFWLAGWDRQDLLAVVWVGGYVLLLEAWGVAARYAGKDTSSTPIAVHAPAASAEPEPPSLDMLIKDYDDWLDDAIILRRTTESTPALGGAHGPRKIPSSKRFRPLLDWLRNTGRLAEADIATLTLAMEEFADQHKAIFFKETLAELHYRIIGELIQLAQDDGATALLVCPDHTANLVARTLDDTGRDLFPRLTRATCVVGQDTADENELYHLLIAPESVLRRDPFEWIDDFALWQRRLRLIVCIDFARLDAALLRLRLQQLLPPGADSDRRVIVQADGLDDAESLVRDVFRVKTPSAVKLEPQQEARTILRVVASDRDAATRLTWRLVGQAQRIDAVPVLMLPALWKNFRLLHFDPQARRDQQAWDKLADRVLPPARKQERSKLKLQRSSQHLRADRDVRVVVTEDEGNLVAATERTYSFVSVDAMLTLVLSRPYPLRDFLTSKLNEEAHRVAALEWQPMAATPGFALVEVAALALPLLMRKHGVTPEELELVFARAAPGLIVNAGIAATLPGVRKLFRMLTPEGERAPKIEQLPRTEAFVLPEPEREQARKIFSFELPAEGLAGRYDLRIPRGDLGLKYAEKTIVQLGTSGTDLQNSRGFYQVDEASTKARVVRLAPKSYLDDNLETRPRYCFDRRYVLSLGGNERDTKLKKGNPRIIHFDDLTLTIEHLHMCFERRTFGFYTVPEDRLPFADGQAPPYNRLNAASTLTRQRFRSVLHLFLANMTLPAVAPEDLAFTSCVALHDVLAALFPREACRLAVLSPQALPLYARADAGRDALDLFILRTYCLLEQPAVPATAASDAAPSIDLYLVEDADYDLGVAGAVASKHTAIFKHLSEYLGWLDEKSNQAPPYHALGRPTPPAFLVFKEAYELLAPIVGRSQQP